LENFSLYTQQRNVDLPVPRGVVCLAGANGVGKSTFLAAVNYALTGRIPALGRRYESASEYFSDTADFPRAYFDGRIDESDRKTASVSVDLEIGELHLSLVRGLFAPDGLTSFSATRHAAKGQSVVYDGAQATDDERQHQFARLLTEAMGLKSFEQFVFLQHFVLTFDESRKLLLWDDKALEAAIFIAFGTDPEQHSMADHLRREMEKSDSLGRNLKWQSLQFQKRSRALRDSMGGESAEDAVELETAYEKLEAERASAHEASEEIDVEVSDADLALANASAELLTLRQEYARTFARHVGDRTGAGQHPVVVEASTDKTCGVCGSSGDSVAKVVRERLDRKECPLCESPLRGGAGTAKTLAALRELDGQIASARKRMESVSTKRTRVLEQREKVRRRLHTAAAELHAFESAHAEIARRAQAKGAVGGRQLAEELERLDGEVKTLLQKSREHYANRDRHKHELQKLQRALEKHYKEAEESFVPQFRDLAERFLGINLDIAVELRTSVLCLVVEVRSSRRREQHQLSESQRFFLDIALRMALAQFVSDPAAKAPIYIDTPEGSLDIAYEARAGEMFAKFVAAGHDLLMTANINTSQLLRKLASTCGSRAMTLVRMTEWAELSDVQQEGEALFREAYAGIEKELRSGAK
jgi:DNA repair exonuclease SbcCD ATPase subunit